MKQLLTGVLCSLLALCAQVHNPASVPSTAAVHGDLQTANTQSQQAATRLNAAKSDLQTLGVGRDRAERKAILIDRWLETHGGQ